MEILANGLRLGRAASELADTSGQRTLVLALEVDRDGGRLVAFTSKDRTFLAPVAKDAFETSTQSNLAQIEVLLLGPGGARFPR